QHRSLRSSVKCSDVCTNGAHHIWLQLRIHRKRKNFMAYRFGTGKVTSSVAKRCVSRLQMMRLRVEAVSLNRSGTQICPQLITAFVHLHNIGVVIRKSAVSNAQWSYRQPTQFFGVDASKNASTRIAEFEIGELDPQEGSLKFIKSTIHPVANNVITALLS